MEEPQRIAAAGADDELSELAARILGSGIGPRSAWALRAAQDAAQTEGIGGVLCIMIPPRGKDHVEVTFTIGLVEVVQRWAG